MPVLILASASPRRRELMKYLQIPFEVQTSSAEETGEGKPEDMVTQNACSKARAVSRQNPGRWVLGADTLVFLDGKPLGKPRDEDDAAHMLKMLSGNTHQVMTGVCLTDGIHEYTAADSTDVIFCEIPEDEIMRYIRTGEPMDKAGAYALQGYAGAWVSGIRGSYSNVIGLNIARVRQLLITAGLWKYDTDA